MLLHRRPEAAAVAKVKDWLKDKGISACPVCKAMPLDIGGEVLALSTPGSVNPAMHGHSAAAFIASQTGRMSLPPFKVVAVTCPECGHVMFLNAKTIGVK